MKYIFFEVTLLTSVGGVQTCTWNLAREFLALGGDVQVITGQGPLEIPYAELKNRVHAFPYKARGQQIQLFGKRLPKILERISLARAARPLLTASAPDSAILFFKPHDVFALRRHLDVCRRSCFHSGGTDFVPFDRRLFAGRVQRISTVSHFNAWQIASHFKRSSCVIHNGVPENFLETAADSENRQMWRTRLNTQPNTRVFAFAGRMVGWKGVHIFLEAMARAGNPAGSGEELWLVGDGPDLERWRKLAGKLGLAGRVKTHPFVKHADVPGLWDAADIGVFPSSGDEAFGISIAEAMARGKPVIASYVGGIPEVVGNEGLCGWLCANGDPDSFAEAIVQSRQADLPSLGRNGRQRVARLFRWRTLAEKFIKFID